MQDFSLFSMLKQGWPVLSVLFLMSIFSTAVLIDRWRAFRRSRCNALKFVRHLIRLASERDPDAARAYCGKYSLPVARTALAVFDARADRDAAMTHAIELEVHQIETGVAALGTIASLAPFVGLLGTVVGIIKAFGSIAVNSGGTEVVSAGIAEALVTTACGLLVAIPAVAAYNYCIHQIKNLARETELAVYELVAWLSERDLPQAQPPAVAPGTAPRRVSGYATP
jgi:biopolymer transport protein ExbB